jgi:hypothetical protein
MPTCSTMLFKKKRGQINFYKSKRLIASSISSVFYSRTGRGGSFNLILESGSWFQFFSATHFLMRSAYGGTLLSMHIAEVHGRGTHIKGILD